ncbi:hypothetical protein D3C85_1221880 [compost metagenome]
MIRVQAAPASLGAHSLDPLRPHVVGGQDERHALALVELRAGEKLAPDHRQVTCTRLHITVEVGDIAHADPLRRGRGDLQQPGGATATPGAGIEARFLECQRGKVQPVQVLVAGMALQHGAQFLQTLSIRPGQGVVHPVQAPIDALEGGILVGRRPVAADEAVDTGQEHRSVTAHIPAHGLRWADLRLALDAQLGHDLGPALGDRLLDHCQVENPGLDHFQHILHGQARIDPLDLDRRQFAQCQFLVDFMHCIAGGAGTG